jgi:tetratricopeptide (TPR) repeat protein
MKWLAFLILTALMLGSWYFYHHATQQVESMDQEIHEFKVRLDAGDDPDNDLEERIAKLEGARAAKDGEAFFKGILLTFLGAGTLGLLFVAFILPMLANKLTHAVYDSGEQVERDPMADARSRLAQGDYEGAIEAFRFAAAKDPLNRLPWVEITKIQRVHLKDPEAAITTLRLALEGQAWQVDDAAFLMFRLAELYFEDREDKETAASIMQQVVDEFPETRHSANARHKLHEWGYA